MADGERVYQYVGPAEVLAAVQPLAVGRAVLVPGTSAPRLAVECDPQIITLPGAAPSLAAPGNPPGTRPLAQPAGLPGLAPPSRPSPPQPGHDPALAASPRRPRSGAHRASHRRD